MGRKTCTTGKAGDNTGNEQPFDSASALRDIDSAWRGNGPKEQHDGQGCTELKA